MFRSLEKYEGMQGKRTLHFQECKHIEVIKCQKGDYRRVPAVHRECGIEPPF